MKAGGMVLEEQKIRKVRFARIVIVCHSSTGSGKRRNKCGSPVKAQRKACRVFRVKT